MSAFAKRYIDRAQSTHALHTRARALVSLSRTHAPANISLSRQALDGSIHTLKELKRTDRRSPVLLHICILTCFLSSFLVTPIHPHAKVKATRFLRDDYTARILLPCWFPSTPKRKISPAGKRFHQRLKRSFSNEYPDFDLRNRGRRGRAAPIHRQGIGGGKRLTSISH